MYRNKNGKLDTLVYNFYKIVHKNQDLVYTKYILFYYKLL